MGVKLPIAFLYPFFLRKERVYMAAPGSHSASSAISAFAADSVPPGDVRRLTQLQAEMSGSQHCLERMLFLGSCSLDHIFTSYTHTAHICAVV